MPDPNFANRTLYHGDNLEFLRGMNSETIDLIATDPPFNTRRNRSGSAGRYEDNWRWLKAGQPKPDQWLWETVVHEVWLKEIRGDNEALYNVIQNTRRAHSDGMAAFICFLSVRLMEMHRILKPSGSIYLHCDPTANAYIRMAMDAIFEGRNFRNEIVWCYTGPSNTVRWFPRKHDTILFYAKSQSAKFNRDAVRIEYEQLNVQHQQEGGGIRGNLTPDAVDIYYDKGEAPEDYWLEYRDKMSPVGRRASERTGSPDQKPLALYERIIKASSSPGDWVLDPFCGCATTPVAAENLGRKWVGIDRRTDAEAHIINRLLDTGAGKFIPISKDGEILDYGKLDEARKLIRHLGITFTTVPPERTDDGITAPSLPTVHGRPTRRRNPLNYDQMKAALIELFGRQCWGCAFVAQDIDGHQAEQFLELDHIEPDSAGGSPELHNRALLCTPCNRTKGDMMNMNALRQRNGYATGRRRGRKHPIDLRLAKIKVEDWLARRPRQGEPGASAQEAG